MCRGQGKKDGGQLGRRRKRKSASLDLRSDYMTDGAGADNPARLSEPYKVAS